MGKISVSHEKGGDDMSDIGCEVRGPCAVAWLKGARHRFYEDRFRLLPETIPLVGRSNRGSIYSVFDGIGGAPEGMRSAQHMADILLRFYQESHLYADSARDIHRLLDEANQEINEWGTIPGTDRPLGGCAGTIAWIRGNVLHAFHAGDTVGFLIRADRPISLTRQHEKDGAIYRYFGLGSNLRIDSCRLTLENGDRILLFSDGVTKVMHPITAVDVVCQSSDIAEAAMRLVRLSRLKGSPDDITVLIAHVEID
jgi:serine/threonine protein phosphatase PrpC